MYLALLHLPDLINTMVIVQSASIIYSGEKLQKVTDTLYRCFESGTFKRSLITSIYALLMASLVFLGILAISSQLYVFHYRWPIYTFSFEESASFTWLTIMYVLPFLGLLYKYMEWSSLWNLGIVTSILEHKHGDVAVGVSAYISRGNRRHGQVMAAIFFFWKISLRLMATVYVGFYNNGDQRRAIVVTAIQVFLVCQGNAVKWVIFMIYFYDCKKRFLEKKIDVEEGNGAGSVDSATVT